MTFSFEFVRQDATLNTGDKTATSHETGKHIRKLSPVLRVSSQEVGRNVVITSEHGYKSKHGCNCRPSSNWVCNTVFESSHETLQNVLVGLGCFSLLLSSLLYYATLVSGTLIFVFLKSSSDRFFHENQCKSSDCNTEATHYFQSCSPALFCDNHDTQTTEPRSQIRTSCNNGIGSSNFT